MMKKIAAFLLFLLAASCGPGSGLPAFAQNTLPWGNTGGSGGSAQMRDTAGTWITLGTLNNSAHTFQLAVGVLPTIPLTQLATQAANTAVANFTGSTAAPVAFTMPSCAAPSFLGYTSGTGIVCNAIGTNNVTLTNLAQIAANTILGNTTGSTANVTAVSVPACATALTYTSGTGFGCAAGAVSSVTGVASVATIPSTITSSGSVYAVQSPSSFRLTVTSGAPVLVNGTGVAAQGTIYLTPYTGNLITLFSTTSSAWGAAVCAEMSNVLANSSTGNAGPAAVVAGGVYDLFAWNSGSVGSPICTLTRGPAWTNTTTRSAGTALSRTNGLLTNSVTITNGPAANQGLYVGTFVADGGSATVSYTFGGSGSGGLAANLNVWNMYNRVLVSPASVDNGAGYTYSTATIRQARASTGNQINFVVGQIEDTATATEASRTNTVAVVGAAAFGGVALNSTTTFQSATSCAVGGNTPAAGQLGLTGSCTINSTPTLGVNFFAATELGDGANANTFDNGNTNTLSAALRQ